MDPKTPARGFLMGLADAVPGVSGGTIALLLGIHPRLVGAISNLRPGLLGSAAQLASPETRTRAWRTLVAEDTPFLLLLGLGLVTGLYTGASLLVTLLAERPREMAAAFLALILASLRGPLAHTDGRLRNWATGCGAALLAFTFTMLPAVASEPSLWVLPLLGAFAACAMILPGISGSYLLLLLGAYELILGAVHELDVLIVGLVGLGAIVGLLLFSHVLRRLLDARGPETHAAMVGLLIGSIGRLWPWRTEAAFAAGSPAWPVVDGLGAILVAAALGGLLGWGVGRLAEKA
ncbi:MAG: DUF368 domain-containing protein [Thermoplasmatota archaeon]